MAEPLAAAELDVEAAVGFGHVDDEMPGRESIGIIDPELTSAGIADDMAVRRQYFEKFLAEIVQGLMAGSENLRYRSQIHGVIEFHLLIIGFTDTNIL